MIAQIRGARPWRDRSRRPHACAARRRACRIARPEAGSLTCLVSLNALRLIRQIASESQRDGQHVVGESGRELAKGARRGSHDHGAARGVSRTVAGTDEHRAGEAVDRAAFVRADRGQRDERVLRGAGHEKVSGRGLHQRGAADRGERRRGVDGDGDGSPATLPLMVASRGALVSEGDVGLPQLCNAVATVINETARQACTQKSRRVWGSAITSSLRSKGPPVCPAGEKSRSRRLEQWTCHDDSMPADTKDRVARQSGCPGRGTPRPERRTAGNFSMRAWFRGSKTIRPSRGSAGSAPARGRRAARTARAGRGDSPRGRCRDSSRRGACRARRRTG